MVITLQPHGFDVFTPIKEVLYTLDMLVRAGTIDTAMGRLEEKSGSAELLSFAALKRFGKPEEVAELLAFCASDRASYMTGIDIPCDGGLIACITPKDLRSLSM